MPTVTMYVLAVIIGLVGTILAFVYIVPESSRAVKEHRFFRFLHDLFNFKTLWIEKILKFFYIFATLASIVVGIFMLTHPWYVYSGILMILVAPIAIRVAYELIMMFVLLVTNTNEINKKLSPKVQEKKDASDDETFKLRNDLQEK